jgi:NAD-dependent SIR2 family protein deacetylase
LADIEARKAASGALPEFIAAFPRLFVLTGAGVSTESGIPDYRDASGEWKRSPPVYFQPFMSDLRVRQRYWARSLIGWRHFGRARPNGAHRSLARLEAAGRVELLVTQNVDGLHAAAGSREVVDLHGRLDVVQVELAERNPGWAALDAQVAPDGDVDLVVDDFSGFDVPPCARCGGILKPDVVFYGENVPRERVEAAFDALRRADAMLVAGTSLMVWSGYRFAEAAAAARKPIAAINLGKTRADHLLAIKVEQGCSEALAFLDDPADHPPTQET